MEKLRSGIEHSADPCVRDRGALFEWTAYIPHSSDKRKRQMYGVIDRAD